MSKSIRKEEFIVCAALSISWTGVLNLDHNTVLCGATYQDIRNNGLYMNLKYGEHQSTVSHEKGFITNKNRFVDQKEALEITGWENKLYFKDKDYLTPEDLLYYQSLIY